MKRIISTLLIFVITLSSVQVLANNETPVFAGEEILYFADFEDTSKSYSDLGFETSGSKAYISGKDGNGITAALVSGSFTYLERHMGFDFKVANNGVALESGTYHARFSYNSFENASRNDFYIANGTGNSAYKEIVLSTDTLNSFGNQWVEVDLEFSIPSLSWSVTVTPESGSVYKASGTYTNYDGVIPALNWWIKPNSNFLSYTPPTIDNFYVTKEMKNTELSDNALTISDNSGASCDIKKSPVYGILVAVDFGSEAVAAGVNKENVEILNIGNVVDYIGYQDGTKWVMEPKGALSFDTTYTVSVKSGIPDGFGMEIEPKDFEFSTITNTVSGLYYDFEDTSKTYADLGFTATGSRAYVPGKDGNGITAALVSGENSWLQRHMAFPVNAVSNGTYYIKYDFNAYENAKENTLYFARGTSSDAPRSIIFDTNELNSFGDQWVKIDVEFNIPSLEWKATITPEEGEVYESSGKYGNSSASVAAIQWWITPNSNFARTTPPTIDNFEITAEYEAAPILSKDSIAFFAGETEYSSDEVRTDTDKIVLDFKQMLNIEDITAGNFIVRNKEDKSEIPVGLSYQGFNELTLNIVPGTLEKNTDYEIEIGNIRNVSGMESGGILTYGFSVVGSGPKSAAVNKILKDSKVIINAEALTAGKATLYAECEGLSELGLITLFYSGENFVAADFAECEILSDGVCGIDFNVTDKAFDRVEFLLVDGLEKLTALSENSVLEDELVIGEILEISENKTETTVSFKRNTGSDIVTVFGNSDAGDTVVILIEKDYPELAITCIADENGSFSIDVPLTKTGNYKILAQGANDEEEPFGISFDFAVFSEYKSAIDEITAAENESDFLTAVDKNKEILGFGEIYSTDAARLYYKEFKNVIDDENYDYDKNKNDFTRSFVISSLNNEEDIDAASYIVKLYSQDSGLVSNIEAFVKTDAAKEFFTEKMSGKDISVEERKDSGEIEDDELKNAAYEAIVLTGVKYADGPDEVKELLEDFEDILDLGTLSSKKTVYNEIRGKDFSSIDALASAYDEAAEASKENGGGGSPSGGSSGNKYTGKSPVTSFPATSQAQENIEMIDIKFEDLDSVDWAYADISELYEKGIIAGVSEARFDPLGTVKREQFIKMIVCAMGIEDEAAEYAGFLDVPQNAWFEKYINVARKNGLVSGIGDNLFGTGADITRQDMAVMLYNAMCKNGFNPTGAENNFADKDACGAYASTAVAELAALGIINGVGDNLYDPAASATRAQAAVIINRALSYLN